MKTFYDPAERRAEWWNMAVIIALLSFVLIIVLGAVLHPISGTTDDLRALAMLLGVLAMAGMHVRTYRALRHEFHVSMKHRMDEMEALTELVLASRQKTEENVKQAEARIIAELQGKLVRIQPHLDERAAKDYDGHPTVEETTPPSTQT